MPGRPGAKGDVISAPSVRFPLLVHWLIPTPPRDGRWGTQNSLPVTGVAGGLVVVRRGVLDREY